MPSMMNGCVITRSYVFRLLSLAITCFTGFEILADDTIYDGSAEVGIGILDLDNKTPKFGEYTGLNDSDFYLIGDVDLTAHRGVMYLDLSAIDLGLDSRRVDVKAGHTGSYTFGFSYDQIPHLIAVNARTPFDGAGQNVLTLPNGFTPAQTTSTMTDLGTSLKSVDLKTERQRGRIGYTRDFTADSQLKLSYFHELKEGIQSLGAVVAENPGRADSTILPQPIDYETDEFKVGISFTDDDAQLEISYFLSLFSNANKSITWDVPFIKSTPTGLDYPTTARIGLPPDNRYQRIRIDGGVNLAATSRFSVVVEFGEMSQDEVLLPYSTDDISGTSTITEDEAPLPRSTAQTKVNVTNIVANLTSRPIPKLGLRARYRFYQTDNQMPYTLFERVTDDTVPQSLAGDSYSRPYDVRRSSWDLDGNYRLDMGSTVTAGYKYEINNYSYREVNDTVENTVNLGIRQRITDSVSGKINYRQSDRKADNYDAFQSYKTLFTGLTCPAFSTVDPDPDTGGVTVVDTCFDNHPDVRKFYIASRERKQMDLVLMANPLDTLNLGLTVSERDNDYDDTVRFDDTYFGLLTDNSTSITLDVDYDPDTSWLFYAFYTHERLKSIQASRAFTNNISTVLDSSLNWQAKFDTRVDTLGVNTEFNLIYDILVLRFGYTLVEETSNINFTTGSGLTSEDMPEDVTRRHTLEMEGVYSVSRNLDINMGFEYETFKVKDWQRDSVEAAGVSIDDVLPLAGPLPAYHALLGYVSLSYTW